MKKMNLGIRFVLGFVSVILCILLVVATLTTAILADLNVVFQKDNLQQLLTEALFTSATARRPAPAISGNGHGAPAVQRFPARLDDADLTAGPEGGATARRPAPGIPGNGHGGPAVQRFPMRLDEATLTTGAETGDNSAIVEWIYGTLTDQFGEENLPSLEVVQEFVEESTVTDFLTDKTASCPIKSVPTWTISSTAPATPPSPPRRSRVCWKTTPRSSRTPSVLR